MTKNKYLNCFIKWLLGLFERHEKSIAKSNNLSTVNNIGFLVNSLIVKHIFFVSALKQMFASFQSKCQFIWTALNVAFEVYEAICLVLEGMKGIGRAAGTLAQSIKLGLKCFSSYRVSQKKCGSWRGLFSDISYSFGTNKWYQGMYYRTRLVSQEYGLQPLKAKELT